MPLIAQFVMMKHFVSKCNFFFLIFSLLIASKHEVLILFVSTHESKLLLWSYVTTMICEPVHDKTEMACATHSVWLDSEALCPCLPIKCIAISLIRLGVWLRCWFVPFFMGFWTRTGPYSPWLNEEHVQLSKMGLRRFWARRESCVSDPTGAHTYGFYRPYICHIPFCKTGHRVFQSPYGVCTGPHCIRRGTLRNP